ncbi:MAG: glycosyltransferase family 4 protein [Methylacidiphilales bacterium]|nr:glycosyltransferase family 4 protein [Candidatus Methylacidiphilales bacterium]
MKIGVFIPNATFDLPGTPEVGGIETFSFTVGEALQRLGHEVVIFGGAPKPGRTHRATNVPLELHPYWETQLIPDLGTRFQRLVQRLHYGWSSRRAWARCRVDLVVLAKPFDWPVAWFWKRSRPGLKVIMGFHGTDFYAGDRLFYGAVDAAFAVSRSVADLAAARVGRRPVLVPNPVDVNFFSPGEKKPASDDWHVVAGGRLVGWKGFSNLVESVARLRDKHEIVANLTIAGDGPERDKLVAQIAKLGLQERVKLCGRLDPPALRALLHSGDLYVQPSIGLEAFSISALEAACTGLPLLLSDQVGLAGYLTEADAIIYPAHDVAVLVSRLKIAHDRRHDPAWTDNAARHDRLREQFAPERVAQQILDLAA